MHLNFRDLIRKNVPTWLRKGLAEKLLYTIGLHFDLLIEMVATAVRLRFPLSISGSSLPYLSRERRIRQGLGEGNQPFAFRLEGWLDAHKDRGGPYPMLDQIYAHYRYATPFPVHLIYTSGARFYMAADGTVTRDALSFDTGLGTDDWAHWWLVYEWPEVVEGDGVWDDAGTYGDGGVWDSTLTAAEVSDLRLIPSEWNAAHCIGHLVVLSPGEALWDVPEELWDASLTNTWDDASSADPVQVEIQ